MGAIIAAGIGAPTTAGGAAMANGIAAVGGALGGAIANSVTISNWFGGT